MILLNRIFKINDAKSKTVLLNAFYSFFIKGLNISVNFLTIPLVLSFLTTTQYGVWLTLTAILGWFSLFDLGFGNGLRNHLTKAIANNDFKEGKIYVSTTYASLSVIFGSLIIIFLIIHRFVNWVAIFNAPLSMAHDINFAVLFSVSFLFVQFIVRLINTILLSFQRAAMADFTNASVQVIILLGLYILKIRQLNSLTAVAIVYAGVPIFVFFIASLLLFIKSYNNVSPSFLFVKVEYVNKIFKLGLSFFIIQIAGLVLYASDNIIVAQLFTPAEVTVYNIAFKYFSVVNIFFTIALTPFWSMTTQAKAEGDWSWIKKFMTNLKYLWIIMFVISLFQLAFAAPIFKIWTSRKVEVPFVVCLIMVLYFLVANYGAIYANFLNGVGKVRMQLYYSVAAMILNIPLAIFVVKFFHVGIIGIPIATIFTMICSTIVSAIQTNKIVNFTARGVWNR